jgi:hypothetical protein
MLFGETVAVYCENHTEHTNLQSKDILVLNKVVYAATTEI